ncbi:hypothetical protein IGB42_01373 [Andreprevotia sp. IGB-42]|uniref:hypothetical protein n=1 Tax=Andreprevotia sp. IGB-42 TaxID=2497473 RepID=UPI001357CC66|nr:hypothetical protein [Andreprevotia sp. IGB-42]KAF0814472.1 hypothetical protein IGB42_01373 [Andreprevotia sp. IGB-42]
MKIPDLFADITPGQGAAGYFLGQSLKFFHEIVLDAARWDKSLLQLAQAIDGTDEWLMIEDAQLRSPDFQYNGEFSEVLSGRKLYYGRGAVVLHFNQDEVLDCIEIGVGYRGSLYGSVKIGDELKTILQFFDLAYDDAEEMHVPIEGKEMGLISFYAEEQSLVDSPDQRVKAIFITNFKHENQSTAP